MHISDGVLPIEATLVVSALSAFALFKSVKSIDDDKITLIAAMSAMFFISTFIHIPFGVTQIHLLLVGVIGLLIGWSSILAILVALILQALLLGYGGVASIGVNLFIMAIPSILVWYFYNSAFYKRLNEKVGFFMIGFLGAFFSTIFLTGILYFSKDEYEYAALTILGVNSFSMIIEGIISMFLLLFIKKSYPKVLKV